MTLSNLLWCGKEGHEGPRQRKHVDCEPTKPSGATIWVSTPDLPFVRGSAASSAAVRCFRDARDALSLVNSARGEDVIGIIVNCFRTVDGQESDERALGCALDLFIDFGKQTDHHERINRRGKNDEENQHL